MAESRTGNVDRNGEIVDELAARIGVAVIAKRAARAGREQRLIAACAGDREQAARVLTTIGGAS